MHVASISEENVTSILSGALSMKTRDSSVNYLEGHMALQASDHNPSH
jgi:hypothetical protein